MYWAQRGTGFNPTSSQEVRVFSAATMVDLANDIQRFLDKYSVRVANISFQSDAYVTLAIVVFEEE